MNYMPAYLVLAAFFGKECGASPVNQESNGVCRFCGSSGEYQQRMGWMFFLGDLLEAGLEANSLCATVRNFLSIFPANDYQICRNGTYA
jgi:hypothetical protein